MSAAIVSVFRMAIWPIAGMVFCQSEYLAWNSSRARTSASAVTSSRSWGSRRSICATSLDTVFSAASVPASSEAMAASRWCASASAHRVVISRSRSAARSCDGVAPAASASANSGRRAATAASRAGMLSA